MATLRTKRVKKAKAGTTTPSLAAKTDKTEAGNDKIRATLSVLGVKDPTAKKGPNLLERLSGPFDALGAPTRAIVHNIFNDPGDTDIDPLKEMGRAFKGEQREASGDKLMADLGVKNKWGQLLGGIAIEILLDPLTYLSFGYGAATKAGAAGKIASLADEGVDAAKVISLLGDDAARYADDLARIGEGALKVDELSKPLQRAIKTALRSQTAKEVGEGTGLKLAGKTLVPGLQKKADQFLGAATDIADTLPGLKTLERAVTPGAMADIRRTQGPLAAEAMKVSDFVRNKGMTNADTMAVEYGKSLMKSLPKDARTALPRAIEESVNPFRERLADSWNVLKQARELGDDSALGAAQKQLDDVLADMKDGYLDRIKDSLVRQNVSDPDKAVKAADSFRETMEEGLRTTQRIGLTEPSLTGAGSFGYVPHIDDPEPVFWDKLKALAKGDTEAFAEPTRLRTRPGGVRPEQPKGRQIATIAEREALGKGTETDIAVLGAHKVRQVERNAVKAAYEDRLVQQFGYEVSPAAKKAGYAAKGNEVVHGIVRDGKRVEYLIPAEVERHLQKFGEALTKDEALDSMLRGYDKVLGVWKKMATSWNPGFHGRNLGSNYLLSYLHDTAQPYGWTKAPAVMLGKGEVELGKAGKKAATEVLEQAKRLGVVSGEFVRSEVQSSLKASLRPTWQRIPTEVGSAVEDTSRMAVFINGLRKGLDYEASAMLANKVMYDYSPQALSSIESGVGKRLFPFMVWQRRNLPNMLDVLIHQPGKVGQFLHVKEVADSVSPVDESVAPEYLRDLFAIPLPMKDKSGNTLMVNPNIPLQDLTKIGSAKDIATSISPIIKTPAEIMLNRDFYFGGEVKNYEGQTKRAPAYLELFDDLLMQIPGMEQQREEWTKFKKSFGIIEKKDKDTGEVYMAIPANARKALSDLSPWLNNVGKVMEAVGGSERAAAPYQALAALTGLKLVPYETGRFGEQKVYDDKSALEDERTRLKAEGLWPEAEKPAPKAKKKKVSLVKKKGW